MSNCTDCIPQTTDPCKGKRTWTSCALSQNPIPSLGVLAKEPLNITLERLGLLIQSCCGGLSTTIPNWEETTYLGGSLVSHKNAIWRSEDNYNETEPDITNNFWTMLADIAKPLKRYNAVYSLIDSQTEVLNCPELNIKIALTKTGSTIRLTVSKISLDGDYVYDLTAVNMFNTSEKSGHDGAVVDSLQSSYQPLLTVTDYQESDNLIKFVISRVSDNETWHGTVVTSNNGDRAKILITQEVVGS